MQRRLWHQGTERNYDSARVKEVTWERPRSVADNIREAACRGGRCTRKERTERPQNKIQS